MPKPIPKWDHFRVILSYTLKKQAKLTPPTLKNLSNRLGISTEKIFLELDSQEVAYCLIQRTQKYKLAGVELIIKSIPERLFTLYGTDNEQIKEQYDELMKREIKIEPEVDWVAVKKEEREKIKQKNLRYFLQEEIA